MLNPTEKYEFVCAKCGRKLVLTLHVLAKRRACTYCGEPLVLSPEIEAALASSAPAAGLRVPPTGAAARQPPHPAVAVECPICARATTMKGSLVGQAARCKFCNCPFVVPETSGVATPVPPKGSVPELAERRVLALHCPACRAAKVATTNALGTEAVCDSCRTPVDCSALPLDTVLGLAQGGRGAAMSDFTRATLQLRWGRQDLGLAEADALLNAVDVVDAWAAKPAGVLSPLPPEVTAQIVQYGVLCMPSGTRGRTADGARLTVVWHAETGISNEDVAVNAIGLGLLATTGVGFYRRPTDDEGPVRNWSLQFVFKPAVPVATGAGAECEMAIFQISPSGATAPASARAVEQLTQGVRSALLNAARQFYLFKAIFGIWTTGDMFYATTEPAIERRLHALGGALAASAADLARTLKPQRAVDVTAIR